MRPTILRLASACSMLVILAGCGASAPPRQTSTRVEPAPSGKGYDFRKEGKIPAPAGGSAQPETDVEEIAVSDSSLDVTEAEAPPDTVPPPAAAAPAAVVDGFRIQIFASADREVAQNARTVASERLGMPAYLDLEDGVYKVRVGDFPRREDAAATLPSVRGRYYPDAWIVAARVAQPR